MGRNIILDMGQPETPQTRLGVLHSSGPKIHTQTGQILSGVREAISFHNLRGRIAVLGGLMDFSGGAYPLKIVHHRHQKKKIILHL